MKRIGIQLYFSLSAAALGTTALCPFAAQADTPAQTQKAIQAVCNRTAKSYDKRDLSGFIAMYSPNYTSMNVSGTKGNFRQFMARLASSFANESVRSSAVCDVTQVTASGSQAQAVLHWQYVSLISPHVTPHYRLTRDHDEQTRWKKTLKGWQEVSSDMTHDAEVFQR